MNFRFSLILLAFLCGTLAAQVKITEAARLVAKGEYSTVLSDLSSYLTEVESTDLDISAVLFYYGFSAEKTGDTILALNTYIRLVTKYLNSPYRAEALYRTGILLLTRLHYSESREYLEELVDEYPLSEFRGKSYFLIGEAFLREGREAEALNYFTQALKRGSDTPFLDEIYFSMGAIFERKGEYQKAIDRYEQVVSHFKESELYPRAQVRIGLCYYKMNEFEGTIVELGNPILKKLPTEEQERLLPLLSISYFTTGEFENAARTLVEFIARYPKHAELREYKYTLGWCHFNLKRYSDAYKIFQNLGASENDSITRESLFWKAECLRLLNKEDEAHQAFTQYLNRYPESSYKYSVLYLQGLLKYRQKEYETATELFRKSFSSQDVSVKMRSALLLGDIYSRSGKYADAVTKYNDALAVSAGQSNAQILASKAIALFFGGKQKEAESILIGVMSTHPEYEPDLVAFYLAECAYNEKNYGKAFRYYQMVNSEHPAVGRQTLTGKAYSAYNDKDFTAAAYAFLDLADKYSSDKDAALFILRAADCYYAEKNYTDATKYYNEYLKRSDGSEKDYARYQVALAYYRLENYPKALSELALIAGGNSTSGYAENALYLTGWIYFQQNKYTEAIQEYQRVLQRFPQGKNTALIYYSIGDAAYNSGSYQLAVDNYNIVLSRFPNSPYITDAVNGLQYAYQAMGQTQLAADAIDTFLDNNANYPAADQLALKKGELYFNAQNYSEAILSYEGFIAGFPKSKFVPDAYLRVGKSYQALGDLTNAMNQFIAIINRFPSSEAAPAAAIELITEYLRTQDFESSLQVLNKILPLHTQSVSYPELLYSKARVFQMSNDLPSAYDVYEQLAEYSETSVFGDQAKVEMAILDIQGNRIDKAIKVLKAITEKRKDDLAARSHFYLGECYTKLKRFDDALTSYVRVINSFSAYTEWVIQAYLRTGECYEALADKLKAKQIYTILVEKFPDSAEAQEAKKRARKLK